jgi:hypothetical protein
MIRNQDNKIKSKSRQKTYHKSIDKLEYKLIKKKRNQLAVNVQTSCFETSTVYRGENTHTLLSGFDDINRPDHCEIPGI